MSDETQTVAEEPEGQESPSTEATPPAAPPQAGAAQPEADTAPAEPAGAAPAEAGAKPRRAAKQAAYDPQQAWRDRESRRQQRAQAERLDAIQSQMEEMRQRGAPQPAAPGEPDRTQDPEGWFDWKLSQAMRREVAPLLAAREEEQQQAWQQYQQQSQQQQFLTEVRDVEADYERHNPGFGARLNAFKEAKVRLYMERGAHPQQAVMAVSGEIAGAWQRALAFGQHPVAEVDELLRREIAHYKIKVGGNGTAPPDAAEEEAAQTRKALASPAAASLAQQARRPTNGKITGAALVRKFGGGTIPRAELDAAARGRIKEFGSASSALAAVMAEATAAIEARERTARP